jgi:hypothetical protein
MKRARSTTEIQSEFSREPPDSRHESLPQTTRLRRVGSEGPSTQDDHAAIRCIETLDHLKQRKQPSQFSQAYSTRSSYSSFPCLSCRRSSASSEKRGPRGSSVQTRAWLFGHCPMTARITAKRWSFGSHRSCSGYFSLLHQQHDDANRVRATNTERTWDRKPGEEFEEFTGRVVADERAALRSRSCQKSPSACVPGGHADGR